MRFKGGCHINVAAPFVYLHEYRKEVLAALTMSQVPREEVLRETEYLPEHIVREEQ